MNNGPGVNATARGMHVTVGYLQHHSALINNNNNKNNVNNDAKSLKLTMPIQRVMFKTNSRNVYIE